MKRQDFAFYNLEMIGSVKMPEEGVMDFLAFFFGKGASAYRGAISLGKKYLYAYGDEELKGGKFAILAGCAKNPNIYAWLKEHGIGTFVTGTAAPVVDWTQANHAAAKENRINIISGTHCSTEKFAPMAMCEFFRNLGVESEFIDEQPNLDEL